MNPVELLVYALIAGLILGVIITVSLGRIGKR